MAKQTPGKHNAFAAYCGQQRHKKGKYGMGQRTGAFKKCNSCMMTQNSDPCIKMFSTSSGVSLVFELHHS